MKYISVFGWFAAAMILLTLGRNKDGSPHHPLRTRLDRPLQPYFG